MAGVGDWGAWGNGEGRGIRGRRSKALGVRPKE